MNYKKMSAKEIKRIIRRSELYEYQVAEEAGISEPTLTRWFRKLDDEKTERLLRAIEQLKKRGVVDD